jgi:signal transduction histidine kinase
VYDPRANIVLLGVVFSAAILLSVLLRRAKTRRLHLFVLFCGSLLLWYLLELFHAWQPAEHWNRLANAALVLLPQTAIRFFHAFRGDESRSSRFVQIGTALGVLALAAVASPWWQTPPVAWGLYAYSGGLLYGACAYIYRWSRRVASRVEAARIRVLAIGGAAALTFSLLDYLPRVGVDFPPFGPILTMIFMYTLSQALLLYRLLDLYELVGRFAVLGALAVVLAGIFYSLVQWIGTSTWFFLNAIAGAFVILIVFDPLRTAVEQKIGEIIVRERSQFEAAALALRRRLGRLRTVEEIADAVITLLEESSRFTHGALYLLSADGLSLVRRGCFGPPPVPELEVTAARPLLDLFAGEEPVRRRDLRRQREAAEEAHDLRKVEALDLALGLLDDLRAHTVFPVRGESRTLGLLAVRDERMPEGLGLDEELGLAPIAVQIAIAAESIELYRQLKVRDRLAVVGEMSAGLAHEIRNPLGSIKAAAQLLAEDPPPGSRELVEILVEEANRLNRVVTDFLEYSRPRPAGTVQSDVAAVLRRCMQMLAAEFGDGLVLDAGLGDALPPVPVDPDRLLRVFLNLGLNAAQAMNGKGRLELVAAVQRDSGPTAAGRTTPGGRKVVVRFRDHGPGIAPEILPRIFIPFYTTRERGTGLGLALSQRIVEDAGGTIEVHSEPGRGADFTVVLPTVDPDGAVARS